MPGALEVTPAQFDDPRGMFLEWFRPDLLAEATGYTFNVAQANLSVSVMGTVRGIHFVQTPPGQAKYVTCVHGAIWDVVVDIRTGSPTFRQWDGVQLDDHTRKALLIPEGLGHGFCALTTCATVVYLCSATYDPARERTINPLDPQLDIPWPTNQPLLSGRDATACTLMELHARGNLPSRDDGGAPPP